MEWFVKARTTALDTNHGIGKKSCYRRNGMLSQSKIRRFLLCERPVPKDNNYKQITMNWKVLKTGADYNKAAIRMMEIFQAEPGTPESDELDLLIVLIKDYDDKHYGLPELDALDVIKHKMGEMGLKAKDLEPIIGSKGHVSAILSGKREITLKMSQKLKNYFSIPAEVFLHNA